MTETGGETSGTVTKGAEHQAADAQAVDQQKQNQKQLQAGDQIEIPLYEEQLQVGTRQVDAGSVRLRKQVTTEMVSKPVEVRRETLTVDRVPMAADARAGQPPAPGAAQQNNITTPFQEGEIVIQLQREVPVVERQMVPAGRIVAQKSTQANQIQVQEQVRRENITVDKLGNPENVNISQNVTGGAPGANVAQGGAAPSDETARGGSPALEGQQQGGGASEAITDLSQVGTTPQATLAGRSANFSGVKVQRVMGNQLLAIGQEEGGPQVFVRSSSPLQGIQEGDTVNVTGTFNKVPSESSAAGWNEQDFQALQGQQVFIEATRVEPSNR